MAGRRPPFRRPTSRLLTFLAVATLVGCGLLANRPVTAQVEGDTYTNPTYRYQLQWDPDVWAVAEDGTGDLTLESDLIQLYLQSGQFYDGDATACRDDLVGRLPDDPAVTASEPYDGEGQLDGASDGRAFATLRVELAASDGQDVRTVVERIDCRTVVAGEAVLAITWIAPVDDFQDAAELTDDLLGGLVIPSFQAPGADVTGVTDSTYTDPDYGFTLSWNEADWFPFNPVDAVLGLNDETSLISLDLPNEFAADPAACVEATLGELEASPGLVEASPVQRDGEDVAGLDDTGWSYAAVDADYGGAEQFVEVRCAAIPGQDTTIRAVHSGPIGSYEAESDLAAPVFASLTVAEAGDGRQRRDTEATPTDNGTPAATPAVEGTPSARTTPATEGTPTAPRATPAGPQGTDVTTFAAEEAGWSISYDAAVWTPLDPALYATVDLALRADVAVVTFETVPADGADPRAILDGIIETEIRAPANAGADIQRLDDPPAASVDGAVSEAYSNQSAGGISVAEAVVVVPVEDDNAVVVRIYTSGDGYADARDALNALLEGFEP